MIRHPFSVLPRILNFVGIAVFAASGAVVGVRKGFDIFGIAVMGVLTGVGGGILRDTGLDHLCRDRLLRPAVDRHRHRIGARNGTFIGGHGIPLAPAHRTAGESSHPSGRRPRTGRVETVR